MTGRSAAEARAPQEGEGWRRFLIRLALVLILVPVAFRVGVLDMTLSKTLFLLLVPVLTVMLLAGRFGRIVLMDVLLLLHLLWMTAAIALNNPAHAVTFTGSNAALFLGGYLVGRACIRTPGDLVHFARFLGLCIVVLLPFALYEALTRAPPIIQWIGQLPGIGSYRVGDHGQRLGLYRAQVVFSHPIHWGLFASLGFALVLTGLRAVHGLGVRVLWAGAILAACFASVSSGPFLSLMGQLALLLYWGLFRRVRGKWAALMAGGGLLYLLLELLSSRPAYFAIVERLAFNPYTAYLRRNILDYGLAQVGRTPVFGVGLNDWGAPDWMSGSVDNFWLLNAMSYGVPAFLFLLGMVLVGILGAARRRFPDESRLNDLRRAWIVTMTSLMLTLATVAIWGNIAVVMFLFLGAGVVFQTVPDPGAEPGAEAQPRGRPPHPVPGPAGARPYTRFAPGGGTPRSARRPRRDPGVSGS